MVNYNRHPTALHAFRDSLLASPDRLVLRIVERSGSVLELSYAELFSQASRAASGFHRLGIKPGDRLVLALPTSREFFAVYLGALFYGVIPLVTSLPRLSRDNGNVPGSLDRLVDQIGARFLILDEVTLSLWDSHLGNTKSVQELLDHGETREIGLTVKDTDIAHLQPTSGSTGNKKIAIVQHRNIVANIAGIASAIRVRQEDSLVFWLPLFHDMGLIAVLCALYWQVPMTVTDPSNFIRNPIRFWLQLISEYQGTITAAPNSAYEACARLGGLRKFEGLDLSSCRAAFWGAEPIHKETIRRFHDTFKGYGYQSKATLPVYGLAEATLAVTVSDIDSPPKTKEVNADILEVGQIDQSEAARKMDVVCVGRPLAGHQIRVVDRQRRSLSEGCVGEIEVAGPSVIDGYWNESKRGLMPSADDFLATGDLGYVHKGELYILGRTKEIIIVRGRNFIPAELETFAEGIAQRRLQKGVAAVGIQDSSSRTETVHLLIETRVSPVPPALEETLRTALADTFGLTGVRIHWVPKGKIPKTTSGKIQRFRCRDLARALDLQASAGVPKTV